MKVVLSVLLVLIACCFCSCRSSHTTSENVICDSIYDRNHSISFIENSDTSTRYIAELDSIVIRDSVFVSERTSNDTVYICKEVWRWRYRTVQKTDSNTSKSFGNKEISSVKEHVANLEKKETLKEVRKSSLCGYIVKLLVVFLFGFLVALAVRRFIS